MLQMSQKWHYANKCPEIKAKDTKGSLEGSRIEDKNTKEDLETKSIRQILVRFQTWKMIQKTLL